MPRNDDDDFDRPRRRPRDDDDFDPPSRSRRPRDEDEFDRPPPPRKSNLGLILGILAAVLFLLCAGGAVGLYYLVRGAAGKVSDATEQLTSSNNLKQIALAAHEHADKHNGDLPGNSYAPDGRPLLSWRVHILPYLGEGALYQQFKLDEPWDSANNIRLLNRMPRVYASPAEQMQKAPMGSKTYYRGFSSPGALFARRDGAANGKKKPGFDAAPVRRLTFAEVTDGTTNTILVLEAGDAVEWTRPDDLDASAGKPFPALGGARPGSDVVMVGFADGSVKAVRKAVAEAKWRAAVTYAGGEVEFLN